MANYPDSFDNFDHVTPGSCCGGGGGGGSTAIMREYQYPSPPNIGPGGDLESATPAMDLPSVTTWIVQGAFETATNTAEGTASIAAEVRIRLEQSPDGSTWTEVGSSPADRDTMGALGYWLVPYTVFGDEVTSCPFGPIIVDSTNGLHLRIVFVHKGNAGMIYCNLNYAYLIALPTS